jgi:hypothetical protein
MNTEICVTCEPTIKEEAVSCPVCFTEEGLRELNGCGHSICGDCENSLKRTNGQYTETLGLSVKYIKCPLCRQYEKKTYEQLEAEVIYYRDRIPNDRERLLTIQDIYYEEARINARIVQLRNRRNDLLIASGARPDAAQGIATAITTANQPPVNPLNDQPFHQHTAEQITQRANALLADDRVNPLEIDGTPRNQAQMFERAYSIAERQLREERRATRQASRQAAQQAALDAENARRMGAGRSNRPRVRCCNSGCETPAATQRRCPNHATIPCCRRCNTCDDCP